MRAQIKKMDYIAVRTAEKSYDVSGRIRSSD